MSRRIRYFGSAFLLLTQVSLEAQSLKQYEYWLDHDYESRVTTVGSEEDIEMSLDVSALSKGLHFYNFRAVNTDNEFSLLHRQLFYIPYDVETDGMLAAYEYWFDADYDTRAVKTMTQEGDLTLSLSLDGLAEGLHYFNVRAMNTLGEFSSIERHLVFVPYATVGDDSNIALYEYWLDNDYAHRKTVKVGNATTDAFLMVDLKSLDEGIHYFTFRAQNELGIYSSTLRHLVYVPGEKSVDDSPIIGYRYIFNGVAQYVKLEQTFDWETDGIDIEEPDILDLTTLDACTSDIRLDAEKVTLTRTSDIYFNLQFHNMVGGWSTPEYITYKEYDQVVHGYVPVQIEESKKLPKAKQGDFYALSFEVSEAGTYYVAATDACEVAIYNAKFEQLTIVNVESIERVYDLGLVAGTYYAVVYNTLKDWAHQGENFRIRFSQQSTTLPPFVLGDVNHDGNVNVTDAAAVVNIILGIPNDDLDLEAADANCDGKVNVTDEAAIVNMILAEEDGAMLNARARQEQVQPELIKVGEIEQLADDEYLVQLEVAEAQHVVGAQFDLELNYPMSLVSAEAGDKKHALNTASYDNGSMRMVILSNGNNEFRNGKIVTLHINSPYPLSAIGLSHIVLVHEDLSDEYSAHQLVNIGQEDGIETIMSDVPTGLTYDMGGRLIAKPMHGMSINSGKKLLVK